MKTRIAARSTARAATSCSSRRAASARCRCSTSSAAARTRSTPSEATERRRARRGPEFPARAKRVICLHMLGAISHVDTFDYKPTLERMHGQDLPPSVREHAAPVDDVGRPVRVPDRRPVAAVQAARRERRVGQRFPAVHGRDRRRAVLRQEPAHRARQSRPGVEVPAHGLPARGPAVGRRVGQLRARLRQPRPAELRRHELRRLARRAAGRRDLGRRASCRRTIRASSSAPPTIPCCT